MKIIFDLKGAKRQIESDLFQRQGATRSHLLIFDRRCLKKILTILLFESNAAIYWFSTLVVVLHWSLEFFTTFLVSYNCAEKFLSASETCRKNNRDLQLPIFLKFPWCSKSVKSRYWQAFCTFRCIKLSINRFHRRYTLAYSKTDSNKIIHHYYKKLY